MGRYDQFEERPEPKPQDKLTLDILMSGKVPRTLSDARDKHIELGKTLKRAQADPAVRAGLGILMGITGDIPLDQLRREHANQFVKKVISQGKGPNGNGPATVERYLKQISPVITTAIREFELPITNPFLGVVIPNKDEGQRKPRESFSSSELIAIQAKCREVNDQRRWAIAMMSDSGARLAEVIGLRKCDVVLDAPVPHITIKAHERRRLKTVASTRSVPWSVRLFGRLNRPSALTESCCFRSSLQTPF